MTAEIKDIKAIIQQQIELVAKQNNKHVGTLTDDMILLETGLDSLCIAILVANLDDQLGIYPFDEENVPVTFGDFVQAYTHAAR